VTIREERLNWPVAGIGGFLSFAWQESPGELSKYTDAVELIDVQEWTIEHIYRNLEIAGSGNYGSILRHRVVVDFKWTANIDLDLSPSKYVFGAVPRGTPFGKGPYLEGRLEGHSSSDYAVALRFQVGDPSLVVPATLVSFQRGLWYFCPDVKIDRVFVTNSNRAGKDGKGVVSVLVRGAGSAALQRWRNGAWIGAGGFGFDGADLGGKHA